MTATLDVAVNLTWIAPGRVGGSEEYLVRQLAGLPDDGSVNPTLYCQPSLSAAHPALTSRFRTEPLPFRHDHRGLRILAEHSWLAARSRHADVVHHGGGTSPLLGRGPVVVTVHDLQYLRFPHYFGRARREYLGRMMPRSVRAAAVVTVPSAYVRGTVIDAFGVDPARVLVVPHGVPDLARPDPGAITDVRRRFGIGERPFVVYPAITHPHKGHRVLVEMLRSIDVTLVLVGGEGSAEDDLRDAVRTAGLTDRVIRPGRVTATDRDTLIAAAEALVFPSEYEGFGAPLVEAMALGTPVVCSSHAAVREVVDDAAVVVAEATGRAWAAAVTEAVGRRDELVATGSRRRELFTPATSGRALLAAYRQAVAS